MKSSVLIAEDDPLLCSLLAEFVRSCDDLAVVGTVGDGREVVAAVERLRPDVLLLDLRLPGLHGFEVMDRLGQMEPDPLILVLSGEESEESQLLAAQRGAVGFLPKSEGITALPTAIRTITSGEMWFTRGLMTRIVREYVHLSRRLREYEGPGQLLSPREREVLVLLAQGMTNPQIADAVGSSVSTVKVHVRNILQKLDLPNRMEAAMYAVREGLVETDGDPRP